jgi:purine-binding chemotaxis protein CheW
MPSQQSIAAVVFRVADLRCAVPVAHAIETMRMMPIAPVDDMPPFMLGVAVIRGANVPVLDLARLLGVDGAPTRLLTVRAADRVAALAVDDVSGLVQFDSSTFEQRPPLLTAGTDPLVRALAIKDRHVHLVLDAARVVHDGHVGQ